MATPGAGKTLLMNKIIQETDSNKYFFLSNINEFKGVKTFNINDLFNNNKQVKSIPTIDNKGRKLYAIIFDEINLTFNRRNNKQTAYNAIFTGLIEFLVSHRHQNIPRVYFLGQKLELQDTQLQSLFKFQHDIIYTKRKHKFWYFKQFNSIEKIPVKLNIVNRVKNLNDEFIEYNFVKQKIFKYDLLTFNTKALGNIYLNLEKMEII